MDSCIICGSSVEGLVCESHQEDVAFVFNGSRPQELTPGRFYRGTVDGYADFGVFVNIGDSVTGLLHRSKLDQRLESLDWEPGDEVYVQVTNVRDNGDVDLAWSIRQDEREFRGTLIDDPAGDRQLEGFDDEPEGHQSAATSSGSGAGTADESGGSTTDSPAHTQSSETDNSGERQAAHAGESSDSDGSESPASAPRDDADGVGEPTSDRDTEPLEPTELPRVAVADLSDHLGETVRLEGRVVDARQTSGPTIFELRDETGVVDCAAFVEAGVRAYPKVEVDAIVRLAGEVRTRRDTLQVETETVAVLDEGEATAVRERLSEALMQQARPDGATLLADDDAIDRDAVVEAATMIRRAIIEGRPVVVRHPASTDGYVAGAAIERAALPLIEAEHEDGDATYHYFDRRPLEGNVYDMDDATRDVTSMLDALERHGEQFPLFVFAGAATDQDSLDGLSLLGIYDVDQVVVADRPVREEVNVAVETVVAPVEVRTVTTVAANVGAAVHESTATDLRHLPATSYWEDPPAAYANLAADAGFDETTIRQLREAIALEAYYQSYEDKRELVADILFDELDAGDGRGLAAQISEQFRTKLEAELETARANLDRRQVNGTAVAVLDAHAYTHRFDFPPADLLLDELHRRTRQEFPTAIGVDEDEIRIRSTDDPDLEAIASRVREATPTASVSVRGNHIEFLSGERDAVVDAVVQAVAAG